MKKKLIVLAGSVMGFAPLVALAQTTGNPTATCGGNTTITGAQTNIQNILCKFGDILNAILPILIALGVVYFVWGVITYVIADDAEAKKSGRDRIIFGIIGLAVIIGVWGLVKILTNTFGLNGTQTITVPSVPY